MNDEIIDWTHAPEGATHGYYLYADSLPHGKTVSWLRQSETGGLAVWWTSEKKWVGHVFIKGLPDNAQERPSVKEEKPDVPPEGATHFDTANQVFYKVGDGIYIWYNEIGWLRWEVDVIHLPDTLRQLHTCDNKAHTQSEERMLRRQRRMGRMPNTKFKSGGVIEQMLAEKYENSILAALQAAAETHKTNMGNLKEAFKANRQFPCEGYEKLHSVYRDAHDHAAYDKGAERHANDLPFHEQRMQTISEGLDSPLGMAYQVEKKIKEGLQMPDYGACRRELLGALNYLAGIVIFMDKKNDK